MTPSRDFGTYHHTLHLASYQQRIEGSYADHEPDLWRAVITQALMDAACHSRKLEARRTREDALSWLLSDSRDFESVCDNAGFDPGYVRKRAREALARGFEWRLPNGQGWRTQLHAQQQAAALETLH